MNSAVSCFGNYAIQLFVAVLTQLRFSTCNEERFGFAHSFVGFSLSLAGVEASEPIVRQHPWLKCVVEQASMK